MTKPKHRGEERSADIATHAVGVRMDPARLVSTPERELDLALSKLTNARQFVDPELSAVYVIGNSANSLLKIGYADNLRHRFSGLNCGSPVELRLVHFVYFIGSLVAKNVEARVHSALAESRVKGEWFDVEPAEAAQAIAEVVAAMGLKWWTEPERRDIGFRAWKTEGVRWLRRM